MKKWSMVLGICVILFAAALPGQERRPANERGPRLSDAALLACLDADFPGLEKIIAARDAGDITSGLSLLADFVRARREPADFGQRAPRNPRANTSRARKVLEHQFTVVGIPHTFGADIDWGFNPTTAPDSRYARDHEWTWQLNRHSAWVALAEAYQATGDERFAGEFDAQFTDWVRECPVPAGTANQRPYSKWRTIEAGIRMSWTWPSIFTIFRKSPSVRDETVLSMVKSMVEHGRYLRRHPTTGNWLTMEMNGLYHAGALLPYVEESENWREFASSRLLAELDTQVYPDGAQIELTPGYHNVALRSFLGPVDTAAAYGYALPAGYLNKLERMFAYNMWVMRPDRDAPRWNDSWHVNVPGVLGKGFALLPHRKDFQWIVTNGEKGETPDHTSHLFPYAGQVVMRSGWDRDALFLGFEAGPFGYGHQHEDKLGIVIFAYGRSLLVEGGSYAYDASKWRRYVLSSYAHNVVLVDGLGQVRRGLPRNNYVNKTPVDLDFRSNEQYDYARGEYDQGFGNRQDRLASHTREVLFLKQERLFLVRDRLASLDGKPHSYEALYHLETNELNVDDEKGIVETQDQGVANLRIVPFSEKNIATRIVKGQETPVVQGWMPKGHGIRGVRPIPTVIYECRSERPVTLLVALQPLQDDKQDRVSDISCQADKIRIVYTGGRDIELTMPPE